MQSGAAKRVFVVDDNHDAADTLGMYLALEGYEVRVAYDGDQAIQDAHEFQPGVALLDIGLPGKDGYEIARTMRSERDKDVMLIAVTGYSSDDDVARAHEAGFDYHFSKPPNLPALLDRIEQRFAARG